jgi:hypothetical protein
MHCSQPGSRKRPGPSPRWRPVFERRGAAGPPPSFQQLSGDQSDAPRAAHDEIRRALADIQVSDEAWSRARLASDNPPPDAGFPHRVRGLAEGADGQARSLITASQITNLRWEPKRDFREATVSHEVRPGANRPGPAELWAEFDRSVRRLGLAMEGDDLYVDGVRWADLAEILHTIADELLGEARATP